MLGDKLYTHTHTGTHTKTTKIHVFGRISPNDVLHSCFKGVYQINIWTKKSQKSRGAYLNVWNLSDPIVEVNAVVRHFRQPWVLIRKIWQ
jgi:hypothetical protein